MLVEMCSNKFKRIKLRRTNIVDQNGLSSYYDVLIGGSSKKHKFFCAHDSVNL